MNSALPKLPALDLMWIAIPIAILVYALLLYDARRTGSPAAGDDQLGLKTVAATLSIVGTWVFAEGLKGFLLAILTFDDVWEKLEAALPSLVVGALVVVAAGMVLLSRTNAAQYPKAKRLAAGIVAIYSGVALVPALVGLLQAIFDWPSWRVVAAALATTLDAGVVFVIALAVLGRLSGMVMPAARQPGGGVRPTGGMSGGFGVGGGPSGGMGQPLSGVVQPVPTYPVAEGYAPPAQAPAPGYAAPGYAAPGYPALGQPPGPGVIPPQG